MNSTSISRRDFLGKSIVSGAGVAVGLRAASLGGVARADYDPGTVTATVGISKGPDRANNAFRSLQLFKKQIAEAIGNKRVVIKINMVVNQSCAYTRPEHTEGILEFLKSIGKRDVVITESPSGGNAFDAFNYAGYWPLIKKYPVKLLDLNQEGFFYGDIWSYGDAGNSAQRRIRICKMYLNPNYFFISATPIKTHNTVVVTLAAKNIGMSAPYMDIGGAFSQSGAIQEKAYMHGITGSPPGDYQCLNDNVYRILAVYRIRPHLSILDGYQGTEHNGPHAGTFVPTPQQLAVTSFDWLAADRIGLTLMGTNVNVTLNHTQDNYPMPYPAVLNYCWQAGLGEWDDRKIQIIGDLGQMRGNALVGDPVVYNYQSSDNQASQLGMRITPRNSGDGVPLVNQVIA
jgi:uncharacterized protein (DUF362 family)